MTQRKHPAVTYIRFNILCSVFVHLILSEVMLLSIRTPNFHVHTNLQQMTIDITCLIYKFKVILVIHGIPELWWKTTHINYKIHQYSRGYKRKRCWDSGI